MWLGVASEGAEARFQLIPAPPKPDVPVPHPAFHGNQFQRLTFVSGACFKG